MADLTWKYVKPLLKASAIEDFENEKNISLPPDLKDCVKHNNGGRPSPNLFDSTNTKDRVFKTLLSFNGSDIECIQKFFPIINSQINGLVPFASDPFGNYLCLQGTKIVLFLHETEQVEFVSNSFSDLLAKLHD